MQGWISGEYPGDLQIANNYVNAIQAATGGVHVVTERVMKCWPAGA